MFYKENVCISMYMICFPFNFRMNSELAALHPNASLIWPKKDPIIDAISLRTCPTVHYAQNVSTTSKNVSYISQNTIEDRPYVCTQCEKTFKRREKLKRHVDCVHDKLKPFGCPLCNIFFARKDKLKRHLSHIHFQEKPFSCNHCDHRTSRRERMRQHLVSVHSKASDDFSVTKSDNDSFNFTQNVVIKPEIAEMMSIEPEIAE